MTGHEPLLAMRRRGVRPAHGVRVDLGLIDPTATRTWSRDRWPYAVVWVQFNDAPQALDLRFAKAIPVVLVVDESTERSRFDALVATLHKAEPASLTLLHIAAVISADGSDWQPVDAYEHTPAGVIDRNPVLTYAKAFS